MRVFRVIGTVTVFLFLLAVFGPYLDNRPIYTTGNAADDPSAHQLTHNLTKQMEKGVTPAVKRAGKPACPHPRYYPIPQVKETPDALRLPCGYYGQRANPWSVR